MGKDTFFLLPVRGCFMMFLEGPGKTTIEFEVS
jgi:hypothetical protein